VRCLPAGGSTSSIKSRCLPTTSWGPAGVLLTPHTAGYGPYLDERRYEIILDNCRLFLAGQPLRNLVDKARWF
jgi:phosphoglycerate dehydrogenase-like enzyme